MVAEGKKRGLGRGLSALIMDSERREAGPEGGPSAGGVQLVRTDRLAPNPRQPRAQFDPMTLQELADSIRTHGILQPLVVTADPEGGTCFWLIAGERRWRAAQLAGVEEVPVIVREVSSQQLLEWALVENVQRADLNPLEEAAAFQSLMVEFGLTQSEVAERVGKSRPAVANTVRLLSLPAPVQQAVVDGKISAGHARALLGLADSAAMVELFFQVVERDLTVRQTEALVRRWAAPPAQAASVERSDEVQSYFQQMENRFRSALATKVTLSRNPDGAGRLVVHFYSDEDLESIYRLIAGEESD
jgi:ParB family chromosome partitioning protein